MNRLNSIFAGLFCLVASLTGATQAQAQTTTVEYLHTDALGTPVAVTDAAGVVIERSEYEPYGQLVNRPLTDGPGFTGHVQDAATGLTYMQQRYYDPVIGRFLSVDPVTAYSMPGANFNRYWYANDNPYRFVDPDGRKPKGCGDGTCKKASWRNVSGQSQGLSKVTSVKPPQPAAAPTGAKTFGPLRGDYVPAVTTQAWAQSANRQTSGTTQIGLVVNGAAGPLALTAGVGVAFDNKGNAAAYTEWGFGGAAAADANAGVTFQTTNGRTVNDLAGTSFNASLSGGLGPHGSADATAARTDDGRLIVGGGTTLGVGGGGGATATATQTRIYPVFGEIEE